MRENLKYVCGEEKMDLKIYVWKKLDRPFDYMNVER